MKEKGLYKILKQDFINYMKNFEFEIQKQFKKIIFVNYLKD